MEQWKALDELDAVSVHSNVLFYHSYYHRCIWRKGLSYYIVSYYIVLYYIILYYIILYYIILYYIILYYIISCYIYYNNIC